ncbi:hypothetical protein HZ993_09305 [Rhodoferax sp. AJA081-3]|uniref:hypothetical protein n=1 Tax=Rhodoferax sp. AJA081-3 TaxID=2752316 RepID=UPI001AE003AC|nr:hypothetical protein [Rhodoferax sp. AJA081-3]QTN29977.1 hypothetical protein HZ993_09305 [Rhodoferax sp. AJA081-3]
MASITAALIATAVLGVCFANTRIFSVAAVGILTFVHPWLVVLILAVTAAAFYFRFKNRK